MPLSWPADCNTPRRKVEFCHCIIERLRLLHNAFGKWKREGLTETQWNKFPTKVKNRYPYKAQITLEEWRDFKNVVFDKIEEVVYSKMSEQEDLLRASSQWTPNMDDIAEL